MFGTPTIINYMVWMIVTIGQIWLFGQLLGLVTLGRRWDERRARRRIASVSGSVPESGHPLRRQEPQGSDRSTV